MWRDFSQHEKPQQTNLVRLSLIATKVMLENGAQARVLCIYMDISIYMIADNINISAHDAMTAI